MIYPEIKWICLGRCWTNEDTIWNVWLYADNVATVHKNEDDFQYALHHFNGVCQEYDFTMPTGKAKVELRYSRGKPKFQKLCSTFTEPWKIRHRKKQKLNFIE